MRIQTLATIERRQLQVTIADWRVALAPGYYVVAQDAGAISPLLLSDGYDLRADAEKLALAWQALGVQVTLYRRFFDRANRVEAMRPCPVGGLTCQTQTC